MLEAADALRFEEAAMLRDELHVLRAQTTVDEDIEDPGESLA